MCVKVGDLKMKKSVYGILIILVISLGVICIINLKNTDNNIAKVKHVSMQEITKIMSENSNYIILDVRTIEEYKEGHIPNAICIPNETISEDVINRLPKKEQLILIYCRSGNRSKQAAEKLKKLGYTNLIEFGGIIDWKGEIER